MILVPEVADTIARSARAAYPYECCGALFGMEGSITAALPIENTSDEPQERRFRIRPSDFRLAEETAERLGWDLVGFYHSHPNHPARPSAYDLEHAWPNLVYLIVAVEAQRLGDLTAWTLREDRGQFDPLEFSIVESFATLEKR